MIGRNRLEVNRQRAVSRIVLLAADGLSNTAIAEKLDISRLTVGTWRRRFADQRLDGLDDEPRPGAPRKIGDDKIAEVPTTTLETTPGNATHWSRRSMARATGVSATTVHRIRGAFGLRPRRGETFKLSSDPMFVDKVRDIIGLHLDPPRRALVLCVDEKSQIQALDVKAGTVIGTCMKRHRASEFRRFLDAIEGTGVTLDVPITATSVIENTISRLRWRNSGRAVIACPRE